jgi:hypothetical protein
MNNSKLLAFIVGAASVTQSAYAEWAHLGSAKSGLYDYYLRAELIKTEGSLRSTWIMLNYKNTSDKVKSSIALNEYDCKHKTVRTNYLIQYDGEMATGNVLITSTPPKAQDHWRSAEQGSVTRAILDSVCGYDGVIPILRS